MMWSRVSTVLDDRLAVALPPLLLVAVAVVQVVLVAVRVVIDWPLPDNHVYLLAYWCLVTGLALATRDASRTLIAFCVVTYAVAPVGGFGWLLLAMGLAHTAAEEARTRVAYLSAFLLVVLYAEAHVVRAALEWHLA